MNSTDRRIVYEMKTCACELSWKPAGQCSRESLLAPFPLPVLGKAKRLLHQTISTYRLTMNYPPAVPFSCVVHHLRTPRKPTQEKDRLAGPTGLSVLQDIGRGENPAEANGRLCRLNNTRPTRPGASPDRYHPCIRLSEPPLHLQWSSLPLFEDRRICFALPLDNISWITILPVASPSRPLLCTMAPPILMIICYIIIRQ